MVRRRKIDDDLLEEFEKKRKPKKNRKPQRNKKDPNRGSKGHRRNEDRDALLAYCGPQCFADRESKVPICPPCDEERCYCKPECGLLRKAYIQGHDKELMKEYADILHCGWPVDHRTFYAGQLVVDRKRLLFGRVSDAQKNTIDQYEVEDIGILESYQELLRKNMTPTPSDIFALSATFEVTPDFDNIMKTVRIDSAENLEPFDFNTSYEKTYDLPEIQRVFRKYDLVYDDDHRPKVQQQVFAPIPKTGRLKMDEFLSAIANGNKDVIARFKKQNGDLDRRAPKDSPFEGMNALAVALLFDRNSVFDELIKAKYKMRLDLKDNNSMTLLHLAVEKGNVQAMKRLLAIHPERDIGLNKIDAHGMTPLDRAILDDHVDMMRLLLNAGAKFKYAQDPKTSDMCLSLECFNLLNEFEQKIRGALVNLRSII